jgi:phospholipid/cholesterol/gamma-HCH transport system substrate-binding protein
MENKSHAYAAGTFVLVVTALLVAMAVWLTRDHSEQRVYEISSRDGVTGLQPQAGVRYKGVVVGRVMAIELDPQTRGNVLVRINVNDNVPVTTTTFAALGFQGVTGLAFIQLDDPTDNSPALDTSKTQFARIPMRVGMFGRFAEQGGQILTQVEQVGRKVNTLLDEQNQKTLLAAVNNLSLAAANIAQLTRSVDQLVSAKPSSDATALQRTVTQAEATLKSLQATTERLGAGADAIRGTATDFGRLAGRVTEPGGTLDQIAQSTATLAATGQALNSTLVPRLNRTVEDAGRSARQVGRVAEAVGESPQSLLLGRGAAIAGPGEPGFVAPVRR